MPNRARRSLIAALLLLPLAAGLPPDPARGADSVTIHLSFSPQSGSIAVSAGNATPPEAIEFAVVFEPAGYVRLSTSAARLDIDAARGTVKGILTPAEASAGMMHLAEIPLVFDRPLTEPVAVSLTNAWLMRQGETLAAVAGDGVRIHPSQVNYRFTEAVEPADPPPFPPAATGIIRPASFSREITRRVGYAYLEYLPADYDPDSATGSPLILFLHGAGERAAPLDDLQRLGPLNYARNHPGFPFIVIAPHGAMGRDWSPESLDALLDHVLETRRVDADRVYLTGFSMGGAGTWETAMDYPQRFAAIAPLCGRAIPLLCGNLWHTPIWAFQGDLDTVVPPSQTIDMVEILQGMGHFETRITRYPDLGHEIWDRVYADPQLYAWFLSHKRGGDPYAE